MKHTSKINSIIFNDLKKLSNKALVGKNDSDEHLLTIFSIAASCKGKNFLELGVRSGSTTLPILMAATLNQGKLVSVDKKQTSFKPHTKYKNHFSFVKKDTIAFLKKIKKDEKFDFVYIDDWHSYSHVKKEIELIDKFISPTSIVLIHDLMYGNSQPFYHTDLTLKNGQWANGGPYRAIAELDLQFWEWSTLPWNNGLTILRKKYSSRYHSK